MAKKKAKETGGFLTNQFVNIDNVKAHYETTGEEIVHQMPEKIGGFVSGVGTGGTLMEIGIGIFGGANFLGSVLLSDEIQDAVVTVFPDDSKKYLSTDLSKNVDNNQKFISNNIELVDYEVVF